MLPAMIFTHVHYVDALSMEAIAIPVRTAFCYGDLSHTWVIFCLNCEGKGKVKILFCLL